MFKFTRFATVSGMNDMCPGDGVHRGLRYAFSCLGGVSEISANQQQRVYKPRGIKETARTMGPSEVVYKCVRCSSVYTTIEDIRRQITFPNNVLVSQFHG